MSLQKTTLLSLISRAVATAFTLLVWIVVAKILSPYESALFFIFINMQSIHGLMDMGLSNVVVVWVAERLRNKNFCSWSAITIKDMLVERIAKLFAERYKKSTKKSFIFLMCVSLIYYLCSENISRNETAWLIVYCALTCVYFYILRSLSFLEGCGLVSAVLAYRISDSIAGNLLLMLLIYVTGSIYVLPFWMGFRILLLLIFLRIHRVYFEKELVSESSDLRLDLTRFDEQRSKVRVTNFSAFFFTNIPIPFVFLTSDSIGSAQFSQTYCFLNALLVAINMILLANVRNFRVEMSQSLSAVKLRYVYFSGLGVLLFCVVAMLFWLIGSLSADFGARMLPKLEAALLGLAFVLMCVVNFIMTYDRLKMREAFSFSYVFVALIVALTLPWYHFVLPDYSPVSFMVILFLLGNVLLFILTVRKVANSSTS